VSSGRPSRTRVAVDGEDLGELETVDVQGITVRKGWLFPTERYVPASAIASLDPTAEVVYLTITKAQVEDERYGSFEGLADAPAVAGVTTAIATATGPGIAETAYGDVPDASGSG